MRAIVDSCQAQFFYAVRAKEVKTFLWIIGSTLFTFIVATVVAYFIYPEYNRQDKTGIVYIALFSPVLKASSRLFVQCLSGTNLYIPSTILLWVRRGVKASSSGS